MRKQVSRNLVDLSRRFERISPTSWFFILGIALFLLGIATGIDMITATGTLLIIVYIVIWIVWFIGNFQ